MRLNIEKYSNGEPRINWDALFEEADAVPLTDEDIEFLEEFDEEFLDDDSEFNVEFEPDF